MKFFENKSNLFDIVRNSYSKINNSRFFDGSGNCLLPLRYFFELTHRCNLACPYCYVDKSEIKEELSTFDWVNIINQIPRYSFITLVGGEPLIRQDFSKILFEASKRVFKKVNVVSNGILLNDEIIKNLIKSKILLLSISLDGWEKNHDKNRNQKGIFEKITNNLENLNDQRKKSKLMVDIKTIVLKDNLEDILKLYEYSSKMGFEFFSISFLRNNNLKQNSKLYDNFDKIFYIPNYKIQKYFDLDEFEKIYLEMQKIKKHSKTQIRFAPKFDNENPKVELNLIKKFFNEYENEKIENVYYPCLYPFSNTIINPYGDVYPCLSYKMGNLKKQSLKEIMNNPKYRCFRKNLNYSKVFSSCQMCCELKVK